MGVRQPILPLLVSSKLPLGQFSGSRDLHHLCGTASPNGYRTIGLAVASAGVGQKREFSFVVENPERARSGVLA